MAPGDARRTDAARAGIVLRVDAGAGLDAGDLAGIDQGSDLSA